MSRVSDRAWQIVAGQVPPPATEPGACLSLARQIADVALGYPVYNIGPVPADQRTASQAEAIWKGAGLAVTEMQPGDLLFTPGNTAAGHVGVYLGERDGRRWVIENNTSVTRGTTIGGHLNVRLTELSRFSHPPITTIIRLPDREGAHVPQEGPQTGGGTPSTPAPAPALPERPDAPLGIPLADLVNSQGAPDVPQSARVDYTDPLWMFHTLEVNRDRAPAVLPTNLGPVSSLVILRAPYDEEAAFSMPVIGPISVAGHEWRDTLLKTWGSLKKRYFQRESWGRYFAPLMELSLNPARYRLPLPDVTEISMEQDIGGNAWAEVALHVRDHDAAEAIVATLAMGQRYRNLRTEIWLPVEYHDPLGGERTILEPLHVGVVDEVVVGPAYPHTVRVRVVAQDAAMNAVGMDPEKVRTHWTGRPIAEIIEDIAADHKLLVVTASAPTLGDVPALQRVLPEYNSLGLPPLDALRHLVERAGGLRFQRLAGTELAGYRLPGLPRGVWAVVDPTALHPFRSGFWRSTYWSRVFAPLAAAALPGHEPVGEVAVLFPADLPDPKRAARIAALLETYGTPEARRNPLYRFLDTLAAIGASVGVGSGPAVYRAYEQGETRSALNTLIDEWWTAAGSDAAPRLAKLMVPVQSVDELAVRSPDSSQISAPLFGTSVGSTLQGRRVQAGEAGALMGLEAQPDGTFLLSTPGGPGKFRASEVGTVYYGRHYSRPALFAPAPNGAQDVEQVPGFYPNTLRVTVKPTAGVRVGMLAAVVGIGRPDGLWQIQGVSYALTGNEQTLTLTLRNQRDLWGV